MNFDQKAKTWDMDPQRIERAKRFANEINLYLGKRKPENALEFGSGTGLVSFQLKDSFKRITLVDTSAGMVDVMKEKITNEGLANMTPLLLDIFKPNKLGHDFDGIYTLLTLHHINDIDRTFSVFNLLLKKGGFVAIGDLITEDGSFHQSDPEFDGHKGFDTGEMKKLLDKNGFKIIENKIFTSIERADKKYPLFLLLGEKL
jgi:ubiquinone/menaquinone biosynthesis C-methylase UbiE